MIIKDEGLKGEIRTTMSATPDYVGLSAMEGSLKGGLRERDQMKNKVTVPVLVIAAQSGPWKPDAETVVRSVAPKLEFHSWPGVSHFLMMERPAEFNRTVKLFIDRNKLL